MAAGDPTGGDLASVSFDGSTLTTSFAEVEKTFAVPYSVVAGTKYAIVVRAPGAGSGTPLEMVTKQPSTVANGSEYTSSDSGSTWAESSFGGQTYDNWFKTRSTGVDKDTCTYAEEDTFNDIYGANWVAQTFTAGSSYSMTGVILKLKKTVFGSPGTVTISLRATEAAFTPPAGKATSRMLVGFAGSTLWYEDVI